MTRSPAPWERLADALLQRHALLCRVGDGLAPRDFAGVFVDNDDVDRILRSLPGLDGPAETDLSDLLASVDPVVEAARADFVSSLGEPADGLAVAASNVGLDAEAAAVLALVAAVDLHPDRQRLMMYLQDSVNLPRPTYHTIGRLLPGAGGAVATLAWGGHLRRSRLTVEIGDGPVSTRMVGLADRLAWHLLADDVAAPDLPPGTRVIVGPSGGDLDFVLVPGGDPTSRAERAVDQLAGTRFLRCPLPENDSQWDAVVREAGLSGAGVIIDLERLPRSAADLIDRARHLRWALCSPTELPIEDLPDRPWRELPPFDGVEPVAVDRAATEQPELDVVSGGHLLDREQLRLTDAARRGLGGDSEAAVRRLARGHLEGLATRVPPRRGWSDLVVHPEQLAQLRELSSRYRNRDVVHHRWEFAAVPSEGLVAVFSGPSGTGKTLAAEVVAGDLGLDLYKVDLSSVVSKYIGETEKNLERIFTASSRGNVVLFFDEADSLFGKRSEVGDAHDRYANIEVSYLLQRLESYDGLVILATNLQRNMDTAFLRRIHVAVEFPVPDERARLAIWALSFPPAAPSHELDLDFLARQFRISGGSIRNAAIGAAFLAVDLGCPITMDLVALALRREFQKLGRLLTEEEFGRYFELVNTAAEEPALAIAEGVIRDAQTA